MTARAGCAPLTLPRWSVVARVRADAWLPPLGVYLAVRLVGVAVLALMAEEPLLDQFVAWDGQWYLGIAEHGYTDLGERTVDADGEPYSAAPFAFFPALPALMSIVATLGPDLTTAGLVVATAAGLAAVPALMRLARHVDPRPRVGLVLVALVAAAPMSVTLSMVYTEAVFVACAAWALVGVLERRWALAGVCTLLAGFTRSSAVVLITAVLAAALWSLWRHRAGWRPLVALVLAPLGLLAWWATVYLATGQTWQQIEWRGWRTRWDWGVEFVDWVRRALVDEVHVWHLAAVALVLAAVVLAVVGARRLPWPVAAYGAGIVALTIGSAGLPQINPRLLLVGAPALLLPVAVGLAGRRGGTAAAVAGGWVLAGSWISAYGLTVWPYAI